MGPLLTPPQRRCDGGAAGQITSAMVALAYVVIHGQDESQVREAAEALAEYVLTAGDPRP